MGEPAPETIALKGQGFGVGGVTSLSLASLGRSSEWLCAFLKNLVRTAQHKISWRCVTMFERINAVDYGGYPGMSSRVSY